MTAVRLGKTPSHAARTIPARPATPVTEPHVPDTMQLVNVMLGILLLILLGSVLMHFV